MDLLDLYHFQCNPVYSVRIEKCIYFGTMIKNQRKYESIQSKLFWIKAALKGTLFFSEQLYSIMNEGSCTIPCVIPCNPWLLLPALALYSPQHCCVLLPPLFIKWRLQLSDLRSLRVYFSTICVLCSVINWWQTLPAVKSPSPLTSWERFFLQKKKKKHVVPGRFWGFSTFFSYFLTYW